VNTITKGDENLGTGLGQTRHTALWDLNPKSFVRQCTFFGIAFICS